MKEMIHLTIRMLPIAECQNDEQNPTTNNMTHDIEETTGHDYNVDECQDAQRSDETYTDQIQC